MDFNKAFTVSSSSTKYFEKCLSCGKDKTETVAYDGKGTKTLVCVPCMFLPKLQKKN